MIDYQQIFHIGVRVHDIDTAMVELAEGVGVTWASVQHAPDRGLWTPDGGYREVPLTFVYSADGPQHIELLVAPEGTPWHAGDQPGAHHVGVWSDDIGGETERLVAAGWELSAAAMDPADGFGSFVYLTPPSGVIVELVTAAARDRFEAWWAGGSLGYERGS